MYINVNAEMWFMILSFSLKKKLRHVN